MRSVLALDMGGSKLAYGLVDETGRILRKYRQSWIPKNSGDIVQGIFMATRQVLEENQNVHPNAIGVSIPGPANKESGTWLHANFANIADIPIADLLIKEFHLPVYADNDGQACTLAEYMFGAGRSCDDFLYLTVSNGIGGGIFSGGRLLGGAQNSAGEIGHCTVEENGRLCSCGNYGCLEAYASGPGLSKTYLELSGKIKSGIELAEAAQHGDIQALEVWCREGLHLGRGIALASNLLNPERVIIGGGLSLAFPLYEATLLDSMKKHLFPRLIPVPQVMPTPLLYDGGLIAAASLALSGNLHH